MAFKEWIADKIIEIILALLGSGAVYYLFQINRNQKASITNSPSSTIIQAQRDVNIKEFRKELEKGVALSEEPIEEENTPKKQIKKIEDYLDENKKISLVTEMSLRLAKELKMKEDEKWLEKEVQGFKEDIEDDFTEKGLKMRKSDSKFLYRKVDVELHIMTKGGHTEKFDVPMFFSQSIRQIEEWSERYSGEQKIIMNAPPMELMVTNLKIDPRKDVPYLVTPSSFSRILNEVRLKIIDFLGRAKKKI